MVTPRQSNLKERPYPVGGTFGELLDWHLTYWGTKPNCSLAVRNDRLDLAVWADLFHIGVPRTSDDGNRVKKLRYWRKDIHPPNSDTVIRNIFDQLFGDDENLKNWNTDLKEALDRWMIGKSPPSVGGSIVRDGDIPRGTAYFVGRRKDIDKLCKLILSDQTANAIIVQGGPGIGKTELVKAVAKHGKLTARFSARRYFVSLETAMTVEDMRDQIARAMGGLASAPARPVDGKYERPLSLLVLDNLETPWENADERKAVENLLAELAEIPNLILLCAMRGAHWLGGPKWVYWNVDELSYEDASKLFCSIAGSWAKRDERYTDFLDALGGLPLAIQLVARRARGRSELSALWNEWVRIGADFAISPGAYADRSTSLPHSIRLSLNSSLMTKSALHLFRILGFLPGGVSHRQCRELIEDDAFDAEEGLRSLGLLRSGSDFVRLLPPIQEYAGRHFPLEVSDMVGVCDRILSIGQQTKQVIGTDKYHGSLWALDSEFSNIELAFLWKARQDPSNLLLEDVKTYHEFGMMCAANFKEIRKIYDETGELIPKEIGATLAFAVGQKNVQSGDPVIGLRYNEISLEWYRNNDDPVGEANCLVNRAIGLMRSDINDDVKEGIYFARDIYKSLEDWHGLSICTFVEGCFICWEGQIDIGLPMIEDAARQFDEKGNLFNAMNCLLKRAHFMMKLKLDADTVATAFLRPFELAASLFYVPVIADVLMSVGQLSLESGNKIGALDLFKKGSVLYGLIDDVRGQANCLVQAGILSAEENKIDIGLSYFQSARDLFIKIGDSDLAMKLEDLLSQSVDLVTEFGGFVEGYVPKRISLH